MTTITITENDIGLGEWDCANGQTTITVGSLRLTMTDTAAARLARLLTDAVGARKVAAAAHYEAMATEAQGFGEETDDAYDRAQDYEARQSAHVSGFLGRLA